MRQCSIIRRFEEQKAERDRKDKNANSFFWIVQMGAESSGPAAQATKARNSEANSPSENAPPKIRQRAATRKTTARKSQFVTHRR